MSKTYKIVVKKGSNVIIYVIENTKKKAKEQFNKFKKNGFADCTVEINVCWDKK